MVSLSPDLHVCVKEHVSSLSEAVSLADSWASAHGAYPKAYPGPDKGKRIMAAKPLTCEQPALKRDFSKIKCHGCGEMGHIKPHFALKIPLLLSNIHLQSQLKRLDFALKT